jgi:hypothetical protein
MVTVMALWITSTSGDGAQEEEEIGNAGGKRKGISGFPRSLPNVAPTSIRDPTHFGEG